MPVAEIESTPVPAATATSPITTVPTIAPTPAGPSAWTVGLLDEPATLLPFSPDGRAAAPIVEAMFPAPVLSLSYSYTTTGILETVPTLNNGGVEVRDVAGFLDSTGQFTVTETTQPTTTQQLIVTYRWNPKLRWADGTLLTAADSVFAYELWGQVQAPQEAQMTRAIVERYEQVDEHTTRAVLKPGRVDPTYPLAAWTPLPRHRFADATAEDALAALKLQTLGYGPFTFQDQQPGQVILARNEHWPAADQLPEQLIFRFFSDASELRQAVADGSVDVAALERIPQDLFPYLDQDQQSGAANVRYLAGPVYEHLELNLADPRLEDVHVRQALAYALNRQEMSAVVFGGKVQPLESWILPDQRAFYAGAEQLTRYSHNADRARALLDAAGLTDKDGDGVREAADGQPLRFTLMTTNTAPRDALAQQIAADLKAVGIEIVPKLQPVDQFYSPTGPLYRRSFQIALFAWLMSADPGGQPLWSCNAVPSQDNGYTGNNFSGWCFEEAEWALLRANSTLDERVRAQSYLRHQRLWTQEIPAIPLMQRPMAVLHHPAINGIVPDALAPITWNVSQWKRK